ncbi:hypothetical protein ACI3KS_18955, partial [Microbacterium sp. ZW T5_45]|uniref:hypothetical protein n=1 Tax=Microbacterium sp. ZW T5_45 TaxID=3378080 RepID=UPI0038551FDB
MVDVRVDGEAGASVAGAGAVVQDQPVALGAGGPVAAAIHIDHDTRDGVGDDAVEGGRVEEQLLRGERVDRV